MLKPYLLNVVYDTLKMCFVSNKIRVFADCFTCLTMTIKRNIFILLHVRWFCTAFAVCAPHDKVTKSAKAYSLGYYQNDYKPSNPAVTLSDNRDQLWVKFNELTGTAGLYNGNISWMTTDLTKIGEMQGNRAKGMQAINETALLYCPQGRERSGCLDAQVMVVHFRINAWAAEIILKN